MPRPRKPAAHWIHPAQIIYERLLNSRGLRLKPGTVHAGREKSGVRFEVVDRVSGEDRGVRWLQKNACGWTVTKEKPT